MVEAIGARGAAGGGGRGEDGGRAGRPMPEGGVTERRKQEVNGPKDL